jgi:uncharacterized protein YggE
MRPLIYCLLVALTTAGWPLTAVGQQQRGQDSFEPYIAVVGEGTVNVVPDRAVIQSGVTTQGRTAREASEANSAAMAKVLSALKANGIAERDIQTAHFSLRPVRDSRPEGDNRVRGFQASNQISVNLRATAKMATVLDQMIAAGANDISGIHFTISERSRLLDNARSDAVTDARRKAELLGKAAGVRVGRAIAIVEDGGGPVPTGQMTMRAAPAASVPVAVGEQTLRVQVSVTFELLR